MTRSGGASAKEWGGISFKLHPIPGTFQASPKLLPDREGWELQLEANKPPLQIRFSPPPASVHFERGNTREIRVYFNEAEKPLKSEQFISAKVRTLPLGIRGTKVRRAAFVGA